jgi:hypothetical protein
MAQMSANMVYAAYQIPTLRRAWNLHGNLFKLFLFMPPYVRRSRQPGHSLAATGWIWRDSGLYNAAGAVFEHTALSYLVWFKLDADSLPVQSDITSIVQHTALGRQH